MRAVGMIYLRPLSAVLLFCLAAAACGATPPLDSVVIAQGEATQPETSQPEPVRLWIKPDLVDCVGEAPQRCMQVARSERGAYEFFYDEIAGFSFVEGTTYTIDVMIDDVADPPADGSSLRYTLVDIVDIVEPEASSTLVCEGPLVNEGEVPLYEEGAEGSATIEEALDEFWAGAPDVRAGLRETVVGPSAYYDYGDGKTQLILEFVRLNDTWLPGRTQSCHRG